MRAESGVNGSGAFVDGLVLGIRAISEHFGIAKERFLLDEYTSRGRADAHLDWKRRLQDLLQDRRSHLHQLNRVALVLECFLHDGSASGYGTICPLLPTRSPILYMREPPTANRLPSRLSVDWKAVANGDEQAWACLDKNLLDPETGLRYIALPLEYSPWWPQQPPEQLPFSVGLIYSGMPKDTPSATKAVRDSFQVLGTWLGVQLQELQSNDTLKSA